MARYRKSYGRKSRKSAPSAVSQVTSPFRYIPKMAGVKSPITQTIIAFPLMVSVAFAFAPSLYDMYTDKQEMLNDWISEKMGGM
tara:strand:+ start:58 stop:309 length:252 start_codon:yes stop_codon:yes gene_type:complete